MNITGTTSTDRFGDAYLRSQREFWKMAAVAVPIALGLLAIPAYLLASKEIDANQYRELDAIAKEGCAAQKILADRLKDGPLSRWEFVKLSDALKSAAQQDAREAVLSRVHGRMPAKCWS